MSEERFRYSPVDREAIDKAWGKKYCAKVPCDECVLPDGDAGCFKEDAYYAIAKAMEVLE